MAGVKKQIGVVKNKDHSFSYVVAEHALKTRYFLTDDPRWATPIEEKEQSKVRRKYKNVVFVNGYQV